MKTVVVLVAAIALASVAALGQGRFALNTHDTAAGNALTFTLFGQPASGSDLFLQVAAGPDPNHLTLLTPPLAIDRTGAEVGWTDPFIQEFTVPRMAAGNAATVAYQAFQGMSLDTAINLSGWIYASAPVLLTEVPTPPNEVTTGTRTIEIATPEPCTWVMLLFGIGGIALAGARGIRGRCC